MNFILSQTDRRPMYVQIMDHMRQKISVGDWMAGHQLPSIRELAVSLRVSVITVKRAYLELEREGVIEVQHGKGTFVADRQDDTPEASPIKALERHLDEAATSAKHLGLAEDTFLHEAKRAWTRQKEETET
ncbi:GntR family transcriptional regulator [Kordiimonas aestuarii]|uniref:GntR family transcriptional regulator n=1 Tax=Kordiimonas aestuarii TaxID=1005925 RepID=UPI0021D18F86|nr:GntR family transcriptional regulator [Kordiimonas aestuarii]